jgi:hypothetical protein
LSKRCCRVCSGASITGSWRMNLVLAREP